MPRRRLLWQLYPSYLAATLLALAAGTMYASAATRDLYLKHVHEDLTARARLLEPSVRSLLATDAVAAIDPLCDSVGPAAATRFTVIDPTGVVLGDSERDPATMNNHATRPEVAEALADRVGSSLRHSRTLDQDLFYVAVPVVRGEQVLAVIRTALPAARLAAAVRSIQLRLAGAGLVIALLAALVTLVVSRRASRPVEEMTVAARRYADGDLSQRVPRPDTAELAELAAAMNGMADQLGERMRLVVQQRDEAEAVLSSMVEGVLRVDAAERVLGVNPAAAALLRVEPETAQGRPLHEVVRNVALQRFVARTLAGSAPTEEDLVLRNDEECFLQAHGAVLADAAGRARGAVIVLNEVTRLRRLEAIRRDFVANVSHELKTPITSLQGFVETLQQSDISEEDRARFLDIVARQAERLHAIIEDLLVLSRIEREAERSEVRLEPAPLRPVLEAAVQLCASKAAEKRITVQLACGVELQAPINAALLEEAVVNLVDNAVKYSAADTTVSVRAGREGHEVVITVRDQGPGIAREHVPRLFERFYRIDPSRSREMGGTGLGLAIVRHIAQAHRGGIRVDSVPGQGSTFTLHLPASDADGGEGV